MTAEWGKGYATVLDDPGATQPVERYAAGQSATLIESRQEPPQNYSSHISSDLQRMAHFLPRLLPLASALLLFAATLLPWVALGVQYGIAFGPFGNTAVSTMPVSGVEGLRLVLVRLLYSSPHLLPALRIVELIMTLLPLIGLLLGLFLLRQRFPTKLPMMLYGIWLALATAAILPTIVGLLTTTGPLSCRQVCAPMPVVSRSPQPGIALAIAGLALGWGAVVVCARMRMAGSTASAAYAMRPARFSPPHRLAAVTLLGGALWAFGLYAVPWATSGCTGLHLSLNHFVRGTCSGLDGYDVLTTGLGANGWLSWPLLELISTIGLFVMISAWLPRPTRTSWVVAIVWCLLATWLFVVGGVGVRATLASPPVLTIAGPEVWDPSQGIVICAAGIALGWAGIALLARAEIAQSR